MGYKYPLSDEAKAELEEQEEEEEEEKDVADSFRIFADDDDDEDESIFGTYKKTKSGQNILDDYKKGLGFDSFF
jgi:hypothetical protein